MQWYTSSYPLTFSLFFNLIKKCHRLQLRSPYICIQNGILGPRHVDVELDSALYNKYESTVLSIYLKLYSLAKIDEDL